MKDRRHWSASAFRRLLRERGWTLKGFAAALQAKGLPASAALVQGWAYRASEPRYGALRAICGVLGVEADVLFSATQERKSRSIKDLRKGK